MRTLKFRVWSKAENRFLYSYKNKGLIFGMGSSEDSDIEEFGGWDIGSCVEDKNLVVQQFTGLHDKNGKEIYEGDILRVKGYDDWTDEEGYHYKLTVEWKQRDNGDIAESYGYLYIPKDREIIGNIFDRRIQESIKITERLKNREKPNLDEVDFGTPHWKEE